MANWNGIPDSPEVDGWHWIQHKDATFKVAMEWRTPGFWVNKNVPMLPHEMQELASTSIYHGRCYTFEDIKQSYSNGIEAMRVWSRDMVLEGKAVRCTFDRCSCGGPEDCKSRPAASFEKVADRIQHFKPAIRWT